METRPHKVQKLNNEQSAPTAASDAATSQSAPQSQVAAPTREQLWHQQRQAWVANPHNISRLLARPVISPDSTYESLLTTTQPFDKPIPLAEMIEFLQEAWEDEGLHG